ncbi:MAG TPA: D-alanyl-D-alanine carboxypeptidase/D-alanyl-D-alanine-endopeptidase [Bryobacteraceae bacterium]|jgi:D-alanyl-D-alanine carboxypeptidase/D-alanyl-D-alanine-endopeptidase (penicillin-binding protein 4)|nr:D-alanyl-D-alanine carboxypeptidase/D-alanyl-D-alanine-endopeptidase [Bryobacteraceae bacterium]
MRPIPAPLAAIIASCFLSVCGTPVQAADGTPKLAERVDLLISDTPIVERGNFGYKVVDAGTGAVLAERNASHFFTPASNAKLYTTATALTRLGPNYRFQTEVRTNGPWAPGQAVASDLELIGGGDPNLSGRVLPYHVDAKDGDAMSALNELADKLFAAGIREVTGNVVGVATRYPGDAYPGGWTIDDSIYSYGAPVSALTLNDSTVSITLSPTSEGELAALETQPALSHFVYLNQVVTTGDSSSSQVHLTRKPGSNEVVLWGRIGRQAAPWKEDLGVDDPALFAAEGLVNALEERGIVVRGSTASVYRDLTEVADPTHEAATPALQGTLLAVHESPPLWEDIQLTDKVSQNLHAEMLLREVGYVTRGIGTLKAGVDAREAFLKEAGITPDETGFAIGDGSGLARQDLVTPQSTVALLRYMWLRPERDLWLQALPIGGIDGSLEHRFHNIDGADRVHAKTGSISHVATLSGYIETKDHRWLAFSAMVNAASGHSSEVRDFLDRFCALFLGEQ